MKRNQLAVMCACVVFVSGGWAGAAAAQDGTRTRAQEPYSDLFGGTRLELKNSVDVRTSVFGVYDDVGDFDLPAGVDSRFLQPGVSGAVSASMTYGHRGDRLRFEAAGSGTARQYSRTDVTAGRYGASADATAKVGGDLVVGMNAAASYSPFYEFAPFIDSASPFTPPSTMQGFPVAGARNRTTSGGVSVEQPLSARTSASAAVSGVRSQFYDDPSFDLTSWHAHAGVSHRITRALAARVQYARDEGVYRRDQGTRVTLDTIDGGLEYHDTLTFARRTAVAFSTSTSALSDGTVTRFRLHGDVTMTRAFRRTWNAWLGYRRATDFTAGFSEPLLGDAFYAGLAGRLQRRIKWSLVAGYSAGTVGFDRDSPFSAYSGVTRIDVAVASRVGLYADYSNYRYRVPRQAVRIELPPEITRQSVSAGLSLWLPIVTDGREPRDPR